MGDDVEGRRRAPSKRGGRVEGETWWTLEKKNKKSTRFSIRGRVYSWEYFQSRASLINLIGHGQERKTTQASRKYLFHLAVAIHSFRAQKKSVSSQQPKLVEPTRIQSAKKRAGLKSRAKGGNNGTHVLGGADYVTLLLGGRRKAADEAMKLPS